MRGRTQPSQTLTRDGRRDPAAIPMVVLVDHDTASAAEIVTAALQDHHRATVVGTHTFGKGVFQEHEPLSNGGALDITVGEYFTPNGRNLGGGGVKQGAGHDAGSAWSRAESTANRASKWRWKRSQRRSGEQHERAGGAVERAERRALAARVVALLEREGRFLAAERAVPARSAGAAGPSARRPPRRAVGARARRGAGRVRARATWCSCRRRPRIGAADRARDRAPGRGARRDRGADARPRPARGLRRRGRARGARGAAASARGSSAAAQRRDLRELPTFTVDPVSARDFDDALSAQELGDGRVRVWVHIADVAAHVREGGALDREALPARHERVRARGGRADAPARALQRRLLAAARRRIASRSRSSSSSRARRVRRSAFYRSLIRSDARLDYEQVDRIFAGASERGRALGRGPLARRRGRRARALAARGERAAARSWSSPEEPEFFFDERGERGRAIASRARRPSPTA